jgi:predicted AlkP superfamily pyrophosphatase or phosphodiesterase
MFPITSITPTICNMMDIPAPSFSTPNLIQPLVDHSQSLGIDRVDRCLVYAPDAIGTHLYNQHLDSFQRVLHHAPLAVPMQSVFPSVTPVAFASMFTGAEPSVHKITKYEKPVLTMDTLFDALLRAGKKVAIVAVDCCSISIIFQNRALDYFIESYDSDVTARALELIEKDRHDFILAYNQEYDDALHATTPFSNRAIIAMNNHIGAFERLAAACDSSWKSHRSLITFSPDHGAHIGPNGLGTHGENIPDDMHIHHFFGIQ